MKSPLSRSLFLFRTLLYHWRTNLAVGLGVIVGTAVIGGALIVGDSVRGSLRDMTLARLAHVDMAVTGPRFFGEHLAGDLHQGEDGSHHTVPAILLTGSLEKRKPNSGDVLARAGRAHVIGLDPVGWAKIVGHPAAGDTSAASEGVVLSSRLAHDLNVGEHDDIAILVELPADIPRDALLGQRDTTSVEIVLPVLQVLAEGVPGDRFGLRPDQQLPANAFVPLQLLQERLGLSEKTPTPRDPRAAPARVNSLLRFATSQIADADPVATARKLDDQLQSAWRLDDFHARIVVNEKLGYLSLESERMILDLSIEKAARQVAEKLQWPTSPVLAYIANEIRLADAPDTAADPQAPPRYSRYSVVAGLEPEIVTATTPAPFGPFRFQDSAAESPLGPWAGSATATHQIVLNEWLAKDLGAAVGDQLRLTYHLVGSHGELPEEERQFVVRAIVALDGTVADDRGLIPEVHGITDVDSFDEWNAPFPMKKVTPRDDEYWKLHRATPKAFVSLKTAQELWQNRYGDLTSFRLAPPAGTSLAEARDTVARELLARLKPQELGLSFQPVEYQGLRASSGTTDFGGLFIGFSFFLIVSAMILIGLLFRLGIERRAAQVGLLLATGCAQSQVRWLLLFEGAVVVAAGCGVGCLAAVGYAALIMHGLRTWWVGAIGTRFLELHVLPMSVAMGALIAALAALGAIWFAIRQFWTLSPRKLLAGVTEIGTGLDDRQLRSRRVLKQAHWLAGLSAVLTLVVVAKLVPDREAFAGFSIPTVVFFVVGLNTLAAGLAYLAAWVDSDQTAAIRGSGLPGAARLGIRNAARHRSRSVFSTGLIASATFLIVAIAAGHRNPASDLPDKKSGNGGFTLVAESTIPVLYDLNTAAGRGKLDLDDTVSAETLAALQNVMAFRVNPGENASCLNIYQTTQPTILGVPLSMIKRGGFKFVGAGASNPWESLRNPEPDGTIPVFGDMNTLQYSLHVGPGQVLPIRAENGETVNVRIAGMLDASVFQGVLLMEESAFQRLYPSRVGYQYFLLEVSPTQAGTVSDLLESKLRGFDAERVVDRLAGFLAVQNTYLSTFQALGGLGLLLGTVGLGTVMLRNILERRSELALLRATGFRNALVVALVLSENALLLGWGLVIGGGSALLAMLPHLLSTGADVPWSELTTLLAAVFVVGMLAALAAVRASLRTPVLATLRAE
ncbi:MAG: ABC transporter permease [Planctomycetes bacterium]|nr:ABC transporter permease [Planctomycetota bacterium]